MAVTKHKLFLVPINEGSINPKEKILEEINNFLKDENVVYLNHSITTLSKDLYTNKASNYTAEQIKSNPQLDQFFKYNNVNTFCVVSLVYKDLKDTVEDVSSLSPKTKQVVRETVESGKKLPKPEIIKNKK